MTDKLHAQKNRGVLAKRILDDPLVQEAFEAVESDIIAMWKQINTPEERESYWHQYQALEHFKAKFKGWVNDGKIAGDKLSDDQSKG